MFTLKNNQLTVEIFDPVSDRDRLGTRYCTGGYIFQIHDATHGPLLSGATYPDSFNWFDGQGIPDSFNLSPLKSPEDEPVALIPGIGLCDPEAKVIKEMCQWKISSNERMISFVTRHLFHNWTIELERAVGLQGRTVRSETTVRNFGSILPIRWYPHPFFPQMPEGQDELIKVNIPVTIPENQAYTLAENGFINRLGWPWGNGYFQGLDHDAMTNLVVIQRHPKLGQVVGTCSYVPDFFPIWGNPRTFSWEPYIERTVGSGQTLSWRIDYDF